MSGQRYSVTIDVGANINQVRSAAVEMQKIFNSMNLDAKGTSGITRLFSNLDKALNELQQKSNTALTGIADSRQVEKSVGKVSGILNSLMQEFQLLGQSAPKELVQAISGFSEKMQQAAESQKAYAKSIRDTKTEAEQLAKVEKNAGEKVAAAQKKRQEIINKQSQAQQRRDEYNKAIGVREATRVGKGSFTEKIEQAEAEIQKIANKYRENNIRINKTGFINENDIRKLNAQDLEDYKKQAEALKIWQEELAKYDSKTAEFKKQSKTEDTNYKNQTKALEEQDKVLKDLQKEWDQATNKLKDFNQAGKEAEAFNKLKESFTKTFGEDTFKNVKNIDELNQTLEKLANTAGEDVSSKIEQIKRSLTSTDIPLGKIKNEVDETTQGFQRLGDTNEEIDHLTYRLKYFFSLAGGFNLMRRAIRSAVTTTKELDAVMTQTAVVSEYTVGDMWKTLPKYSKEAKKLGTAIKDIYGAQTLYVQQGLNMNDAMDLGVETLKMARVANIGAEEATNSMTAALRGFNMELNETSAKRVNDVYSKLAQNTASDTQEISTAMTKTAALANSANMSFENTAAFLATIIESTREGAETAGTALKTVIARFSEVKKLYSEDQLTGTDEEGQEIDVNKIATALRTAGINMNEFFLGTKGLDEIFLELGSKWDSLTTVQQRYIATQAAGSRQQSRFLALMQNYSRTVELTSMAYNSAGSGQEQFEKTLDSLEAKTNQFKDTWDTLMMGIANSDMIKGFIDFGTQVLEVFNNIVEVLSGGNGVIKSITSLGLAIGTFKLGRGLFGKNGILGALISKDPSKLGANFGKTFVGGFWKSIVQQGQGGQAGAVKQYLGGYFYQNFGIKKHIPYDFINDTNKEAINSAYHNYKTELAQINSDQQNYEEAYKNYVLARDQGVGGIEEPERPNTLQRQADATNRFYSSTGLSKEQNDELIRNGLQKTIVDYNALGNAAMLAGTAVCGVTAALQANGKIGEKTAGVIKGVAAGFIAMGGAMKIITALGSVFGATFASLAGPIGIAVGAVALIAGVVDALTESDKEKTERYKKELEESSESLTSLKNKYKELEGSIDSLSGKEDAFKGLIKGTQEWDDAVKDLNASISTLVEKYPELIEALEYNENGTLTLNKDKVKEIQEQYKDQITNAEYRNIAAKNLISQQNYEEKWYETSRKTAGFADLPIFTSDEDSVKKIKESIIKGIDQGLLAELASYSIDDIQDSTSNGYKNIISLISDYLSKQGFNQTEIDSTIIEDALLQGAVGRELNRQAKKNYDKEILQNSFEQRQKIIEDTFVAETGAIKNLALKGTEKIYSKAYENLNITDEDLKGIGGLKAKWATSIGATYVNDKKYILNGQELKFEDDTVKAWAQTKAASEAVEEASDATQEWFSKQTKNVKDFVNGVGKRSDLSSKEIKDAFSDLDEGLFDYSDVKNKWQQSYNEIDANVSEALEGIFKDQLDEIDKEIEVTRKQKGSGVGEGIKVLEAKRLGVATGGLSELDLGVSAYDKIAQLIVNASNNYGNKVAGNLANAIVTGINGQTFANQENKNKFASALYEVNWKTIKSTDDLVLALSELGVAVNPTADGFETLAKSLLETQKALKTLSLKDLQKEAKERIDLRDSLKTATNATFSEEDYQKLLGYGAKRSDFVYTGQGYTYTGGQVKDLATTIDNNLGSIVEDTKKNLQQQIDVGKSFEQSVQASTDNSEDFGKFLSGELDKDNADTIRSIFSNLGIKELYNELTGEKVNLDEITTPEGLVDYYKKYLDYYANYKSKELQIADIDKNSPFFGKTADYVRQNGGDNQQQIAAAIVDAEKIGVSIKDLTNYAQQLSTLNTVLQDTAGEANGLAYAIAYDNMLMNQGLQELINNYDTWEKVLKAAEENEKVKDTQDYTNTVVGLREVLQKITGTTSEFSEEFLTAAGTLDLFKKAAKGDTDAIDQLRKNAAKDLLPKNLDKATKEFKDFQSAVDDLDFDNIKAGDQISKSIEDTIDNLMEMGSVGIEQAQAIYEALGFEPPEFEPQPITYEADMPTIGTEDETASGKIGVSVPATPLTPASSAEGSVDVTIPSPVALDGGTAGRRAKNSHAVAKGGAGSTANPTNKKGGGGGGGSKEFKNDFDKYYNQVEDINELERQRNLLESDYNQLLKNETKSGKEIYDNLKKQLQLLEERRELTADLAEKRKQQIIETTQAEEYSKVAKYAWWNESDLTIEIDWGAINQVKDSEEGDLIKEYVKKLEDFQSKYDDQIEALEEIENTVKEIEERGKEEYTTLEDRVRDALIKQIQDKIDELTEVDEAINDTNQKLFDSMQETLEKQRQERDNAKTEEELTDKEKRLAYLQQDSSNANALEIAKLQEELADERQNYTDTLIDQKISELQQQNDQAQEQRQEQIDLMQRSLDWQEKSGAFWETVYQYISEGTDAVGALVKQSELERLLRSAETWDSLSEEQKQSWAQELIDQVTQGIAYLELSRQLEDIGTKEGTSISFTNANGQTLTGKVDKNGNVVVTNSDGSTITYKDVFQDYHGAYRTFETSGEVKAAPKPTVSTSKPITGTSSPTAGASGQGTPKTPQRTVDPSWTTNETYHWHKVFYDGKESTEKDNCGIHEWGYVPGAPSDIRRCSVCGRTKTVSTKPGGETSSGRVAFSSGVAHSTRVMLRYASGGLNTQAGPAWLDGTASNPELVLNARDTQNFIELKDVLADMRKNGGFSLTGGDNYYNISVNVDQMSSDYDVDRAIDRIKARIAQDGAYRNVNTLSRLR